MPVIITGTSLKKQLCSAFEKDVTSAVVVLFNEVDRKACEHLSRLRNRHFLPQEFEVST